MKGLDFSGKELTGHYYEDETFADIISEIRSYTWVYFVVKKTISLNIRDALTKKLPDYGRSKWNEFYYRLSFILTKDEINVELYKNIVNKYVAFSPLKYIKFKNCSLCDYQIIELALIFTDLKELEYIDLSDNKLTKKVIPILISIVKLHPKLKNMYISNNYFSHKKIAHKAKNIINKNIFKF